jgi:foldase protein PrsA
MAKKPNKKRVPKELTRRQVSRLERERRMEKALVWGAIAVGVIVVGVLLYGLVVENIIKARQPVAIVGDVPIRTDEFQARVRFTRMQMQLELSNLEQQRQSVDPSDETAEFVLNYLDNSISQLQSELADENALALGDQAVDALILYELGQQEAERRGIVIAEDDVQRAIEVGFGYDRDLAASPLSSAEPISPTEETIPTPTPMTEDEFLTRYNYLVNDLLKPLDISEGLYRSWIEADLAVQEVRAAMLAETPTEADQVKVTVLSAAEEAQANGLAARLDEGETLAAISEELEAAEEPQGYVTELDWLPQGALGERLGVDLADLAFSLEVGEHTPPVLSESGQGYYIVAVLGHEVRELAETVREELADDLFQTWYEAQQVLVERKPYSDRVPTEP